MMKPFFKWGAIPVVAILLAGTAFGKTEPETLQKEIIETISESQATQASVKKWADERAALLNQIRDATSEQQWLKHQLKKYNTYLEKQEKAIAELKQQKREAEAIRQELEPFLDEAAAKLAQFVKNDLPFLTEERQDRISSLVDTMNDYRISLGEKTRRLLEACQVEAQYGSDFTRLDTDITVNGELIRAQVLRLGRAALFFRTPDGSRAGRYNPDTDKWELLPQAHESAIHSGIDVADKKETPTLLNLPVGRAKQ